MRVVNGVHFPKVEPVMLCTTLNLAKDARECGAGGNIAEKLGIGPDEQVSLLDVMRVGGIDNALWCLRCVLPGQGTKRDKAARLIAAEFAARVLHIYEGRHPGDERPRKAVEAARDFAFGLIDAPALYAALAAAWAADCCVAGNAAGCSACTDAKEAARYAAVGTAWEAARYAARGAVRAAYADERNAQAEILRTYLKADSN